jgi:hypothetical protein
VRAHAFTVVALILLLLAACRSSSSPVLHRYGTAMPSFPDQCEGGLHPGVDFRARVGTPVLASADGLVTSIRETETGGGVLLLEHQAFQRYTAYAHLDWTHAAHPVVGQQVSRGQIIGHVGMYRNSGPAAHVHLELCTTACDWGHPECTLDNTEDPLTITMGCFEAQVPYAVDELVLTYPVSC